MKTWKIELTVQVSDNWIEDGFNLSDGRLEDLCEGLEGDMLPYAVAGREVIVSSRIISEPTTKAIRKAQGYQS